MRETAAWVRKRKNFKLTHDRNSRNVESDADYRCSIVLGNRQSFVPVPERQD